MWDSVLLNDTFGLALIKSAIASGDVALITPETESEKQQLESIKSKIKQTRADRAALTYALLADKVWIDGSNFMWEVFSEINEEVTDENVDEIKSRPFIESITPEFNTFVRATSSGLNYITSGAHDQPAQTRANLYASLEPLIWYSFTKKSKSYNLNRNTLRDILDILVMEPHLIDIRRNHEVEDFDHYMLEMIKKYWSKSNLTQQEQNYLKSMAYFTMVKGDVAANTMEEAKKLNAVYPVRGLSFGKDRHNGRGNILGCVNSHEVIAATKIFLNEVENWPDVNNFSDLLRVRQNPAFNEFQIMLRNWVSAIVNGDQKAERSLRTEIRSANAALKTSVRCCKIGSFFTYIGLPLLIVDAVFGLGVGTVTTVAGYGLQTISDWKKEQHKWLIVGE